MYLMFLWGKEKKQRKKNSVLGEGCGREEADTYRSHDAQPVSLARQAVPPPSGRGAHAAGRAGAGKGGGRTQIEGSQGLKTPKAAEARPARPALSLLGPLLHALLLLLHPPKREQNSSAASVSTGPFLHSTLGLAFCVTMSKFREHLRISHLG